MPSSPVSALISHHQRGIIARTGYRISFSGIFDLKLKRCALFRESVRALRLRYFHLPQIEDASVVRKIVNPQAFITLVAFCLPSQESS